MQNVYHDVRYLREGGPAADHASRGGRPPDGRACPSCAPPRSARAAGPPAKKQGAFRSILFPPGKEPPVSAAAEEPACFADLNLDQVVAAITEGQDEQLLRPIFYVTYKDEEIIDYRQAVFADLEEPAIFGIFPAFTEAMGRVRANLAYAAKISSRCHGQMVLLRAAACYCEAVGTLLGGLRSVAPRSSGLAGLKAYVAAYAASEEFGRLAAETNTLRTTLLKIEYSMLFHGDKVTVRKYASEPDYAATLLDRFARFRAAGSVPRHPSPPADSFSLNHIEEGILEFVGRLFPGEFGQLATYVARHADFIDGVVERFDREIRFFLAYRAFIDPLRQAGLPFCRPAVSASDKRTRVVGGFDLALALRLVAEKRTPVRNDFSLSGAERMLVVSGPNQGGKTTFARMFGQLHVLAGLGCPVPAGEARLFLADRVFTHFERGEDITHLRGKLEDELVLLHETCREMTSDSVVVLNEIFNSTSLEDQVFLSKKIFGQIFATDALGVCVTFIDELAALGEKTVSMVSTVDPGNPGHRTFLIVRKPADGLAYAISLARKRGVTYEQLRGRVRP